jgi:hypothetical protein
MLAGGCYSCCCCGCFLNQQRQQQWLSPVGSTELLSVTRVNQRTQLYPNWWLPLLLLLLLSFIPAAATAVAITVQYLSPRLNCFRAELVRRRKMSAADAAVAVDVVVSLFLPH